MHDIWNPWHGCIKYSEGCDNCYMYFLDRLRDQDGRNIYKTKSGSKYPLQKNKNGEYKIKSGEMIRVCMTSDFFLEEADRWRDEAWEIMHIRSDVKFFLLTKRPQRVLNSLPYNWGDGWENVFFNVTCENQRRADERIPILLELPFKHKGIMAAPLLSGLDIDKYLSTQQIEQVLCGGENYDGSRICKYEWVKSLSDQCRKYDITFNFIETGTYFAKDGRVYHIPDKRIQSRQAYRSGLSYKGRPINFDLKDIYGRTIPAEDLYTPAYHPVTCLECASRMTCNGCYGCGNCENTPRK